ncbi:uracil-DNA glycosylase [Ottowia caeni]|uniref:uracil-DNA glycosylase n=1 Tax=Ottowia caeni TaxID=2870339 RepID=UPI003D73747B|nr:uracil-DNA glycosylase [Ottowia caeni]
MATLHSRHSLQTSPSLFGEGATSGASLQAWPTGAEQVASGWRPAVDHFLQSDAGRQLSGFLQDRIASGVAIYPPSPLRALALTPPEAVRVVILGQDPYHGPGQANGLAFDVGPGIRPPPSLRNIHKELAREFGSLPRPEGLLEHWASQGVLLLNTSMTVEAGQAASHARIGWQVFTDAIFDQLVKGPRPLAFMLWGAHAQSKAARCKEQGLTGQHLWLLANHPSPLSALRPPVPFIGCGHFGRVNSFLVANGQQSIDWIGKNPWG